MKNVMQIFFKSGKRKMRKPVLAGVLMLALFGCEPESFKSSEKMIEPSNLQNLQQIISPDDPDPRGTCNFFSFAFEPVGPISYDAFIDQGVTIFTGSFENPQNAYIKSVKEDWQNYYPVALVPSFEPTDVSLPILGNLKEPADRLEFKFKEISDNHNYYIVLYSGENGTGEIVFEQVIPNSEYWDIIASFIVSDVTFKSFKISVQGDTPANPQVDMLFWCIRDADVDGILDSVDNCLDLYNPNQEDFDGDGLGDACDSDIDNDGVPNEIDSTPNSNSEATITIGTCDTGVTNTSAGSGSTMSDLVDELESGIYKNLGQEIKTYTQLTNLWIEMGLITAEQKNSILNCTTKQTP